MIYFGCDFTFKDAAMWFDFIDKFMHYANRDGRMNVFYSTPERFLASKKAQLVPSSEAGVHSKSKASSSQTYSSSVPSQALPPASSTSRDVRWPLKSDDFLPYRCEGGYFWTGARPAAICHGTALYYRKVVCRHLLLPRLR
jgi:hypothetical protein